MQLRLSVIEGSLSDDETKAVNKLKNEVEKDQEITWKRDVDSLTKKSKITWNIPEAVMNTF